jgi:probable HAF family extracellular repeat protein
VVGHGFDHQSSTAVDIDNAGTVVLNVEPAGGEVFRWRPSLGLLEPLDNPAESPYSATGMNNMNQVVGVGDADESGRKTGFVERTIEGHRPLTVEGRPFLPAAINDYRWIVGTTISPDGPLAYLTKPSGEVVRLSSASGTWIEPFDLNNKGAVVGAAVAPEGHRTAFLWVQGEGFTALGTLGGGESTAYALNEDNVVVGESETSDGSNHAFLWTSENGMVDLGTLGGSTSRARDVNDYGTVVGYAETVTGVRCPFLWTGMTGIQPLVHESSILSELGEQARTHPRTDVLARDSLRLIGERLAEIDTWGTTIPSSSVDMVEGSLLDAARFELQLGEPAEASSSLLLAGAATYGTLIREGWLGFRHLPGDYAYAALMLARETNNQRAEARALSFLADLLLAEERVDSAKAVIERALTLHQEVSDPLAFEQAIFNLAQVHRRGAELDSALAYGRRSVDLSLNNPGLLSLPDSLRVQRLGRSYLFLGAVFSELGQPDSAQAYLHTAGYIYSESGSATDRLKSALLLVAQARFNVFSETLQWGHTPRFNLAPEVQDSSLFELLELAGYHESLNPTPLLADFALQLGGQELLFGNVEKAEFWFTTALEFFRATEIPPDPRVLRWLAILKHRFMGEASLAESLPLYREAALVDDSSRHVAGSDDTQVRVGEASSRLAQQWILAELALPNREREGARGSALSALAASEQGRAQALRSWFPEAESMFDSGKRLEDVGKDLLLVVAKEGTGAVEYFLSKDTLIIWAATEASDLEVFRVAFSSDSLAAVVGSLREAWGVGEGVRSRVVPERSPSLEPARTSRSSVVAGGDRVSQEALEQQLARILFPDQLRLKLSGVRELLIVPHGFLALVPFSTLPINGESRLLADRWAIRYAPSMAVAKAASSRPIPSRGVSDALVVGNPTMPSVLTPSGQRVTLQPLPGAEAEAAWVGDLLGAQFLLGLEADEWTVRNRLPMAPVVHFSTHGFAYSTPARARESYVALAPSPTEDGLLTVREILEEIPRVTADLVVLSACQTGLGDIQRSEGTIGLQRALLAKGARSVLVSLWNVDDRATALLMERFYWHWVSGPYNPGKAEALRRAQLDVRGEPGSRYHHPRFWAAFLMVGAN